MKTVGSPTRGSVLARENNPYNERVIRVGKRFDGKGDRRGTLRNDDIHSMAGTMSRTDDVLDEISST